MLWRQVSLSVRHLSDVNTWCLRRNFWAQGLQAVLNRVGRHHGDEEVRYDMFEPRRSARALVYVIEQGLRAVK